MFKPLDRLAAVLTLLLAVDAGGTLWAAMPSAAVADPEQIDSIGGALAFVGVAGLVIASMIASAIVFLVWLHRAAKNARVLAPSAVWQFTPGWAVGWWFVPFANLFRPFKAMIEIWQNSEGAASYGQTPQLVSGWWAMWIVSVVFDRVALRAAEDNGPLAYISAALDIASTVLCILVVRKLTAIQNERAMQIANAPHVSGTTPFAT